MSEEFFDYEAQEPKNNLIAFLLIAACLFLVATFILLSWMFTSTREAEQNKKLNEGRYVELQELRKSEDAKLGAYQYIDKDKGIVRIPVERAMQLMAEEAKTSQPKTETAPVAAKPEVKAAAVTPAKPEAAKSAAAGHKK